MPSTKIDPDRLRARLRDAYLSWGHDPKRWKGFEPPASISKSMFMRYKKEVRDDLIRRGLLEPKGKPRPLAQPEDTDRAKAIAKRADIDEKTLAKPIELMSQIDRMLGICDLLDKDAVDEKAGKVRDAGDAREAVKVRASVLKLAVDAQSTLFDTNRIQRVHSVMFSRIAETDPEVARRILADLNAIDREYGIALQ